MNNESVDVRLDLSPPVENPGKQVHRAAVKLIHLPSQVRQQYRFGAIVDIEERYPLSFRFGVNIGGPFDELLLNGVPGVVHKQRNCRCFDMASIMNTG